MKNIPGRLNRAVRRLNGGFKSLQIMMSTISDMHDDHLEITPSQRRGQIGRVSTRRSGDILSYTAQQVMEITNILAHKTTRSLRNLTFSHQIPNGKSWIVYKDTIFLSVMNQVRPSYCSIFVFPHAIGDPPNT